MTTRWAVPTLQLRCGAATACAAPSGSAARGLLGLPGLFHRLLHGRQLRGVKHAVLVHIPFVKAGEKTIVDFGLVAADLAVLVGIQAGKPILPTACGSARPRLADFVALAPGSLFGRLL